MSPRRARSRLVVATITACVVIAVAPACKKKSKSGKSLSAEVTGLAAVPANADVVIGVEVAKLAASPIVERAVSQLLLRDAQLAQSWEHIRDTCKIDVSKQVKRVMLALGPSTEVVAPAQGSGATAPAPAGNATTAGKPPGPGPVLLVATGVEGAIGETELAACIRSLVGKGGGTLTAKPLEGRTLYQVKEANRTMFFAFGRADTILLSTSEPYLVEALGTGKKAPDHPELAKWLELANQNAPLWGVGRVSPRVRQGLTKVASGLKAGPSAFVGSVDLTEGAKLQLIAVMASPEDAKQLESLAKGQLVAASMWAQMKSLGELVQKVTITAEGGTVRFAAELSMEQVNQLLSVLDAAPPPAQDSPPASGGSASVGSASDGSGTASGSSSK